MMGVDGGLLILGALACGLGLPLLVLAGGWMVLHGSRRDRADAPSSRALLDQRLAAGEIDVEEYYERESALRSAQPPSRGRWRP